MHQQNENPNHSKLTTLQEKIFLDAPISEEGVKRVINALKTNPKLVTLKISNAKLQPDTITSIAKCLENNTVLRKLVLINNQIEDEGAKAIALALTNNTTLQKLSLHSNHISDEGAKAIALALAKNTTLQALSLANRKIANAGVQAIAKALLTNISLESVNLGYSKDPLLPSKEIKAKFYNLFFKHIELLTERNKLIKQYPTNAAQIKQHCHQHGLYKASSNELPNNDFSNNNNKEEQNDVFEQDFEKFTNNLKNHLNEIAPLQNSQYQGEIDFQKASTIADNLKNNSEHKNLKFSYCTIQFNEIKLIADGLKNNNTVCSLSFFTCQINNKGAELLAGALKNNICLEELDLCYNNIDNDGFKALANALKYNTTLQKFIFFNNTDTNSPASEEINLLIKRNLLINKYSCSDRCVSEIKKFCHGQNLYVFSLNEPEQSALISGNTLFTSNINKEEPSKNFIEEFEEFKSEVLEHNKAKAEPEKSCTIS